MCSRPPADLAIRGDSDGLQSIQPNSLEEAVSI